MTDKEDGTPLIGVTVVEVDANGRFVNGAQTDFNGMYSLTISQGNVKIQFSYIGYQSVTEIVGSRTKIDIALGADVQALDEVEIVADKMDSEGQIKVRNQTVAVSRVQMSDLEDLQATSPAEALQGRISNVDIVADSGDPGAGISIRIRGSSTINGNANPLIVVDGVPYEATIIPGFDFNSGDVAQFGSLIDMSPEDIQDIQITKDAASSAIYGSRAANGVVIITTKRGGHSKPRFSYNIRTSIGEQAREIPLLSGEDYVRVQKEAIFNKDGNTAGSARELAYDREWERFHEYAQNTDWVKAITQRGVTHQHNLSVQGGGSKAKYFVSVGYKDQQGTTIGTSFKQLNTRVNLDYDISEKIKFKTDMSYTRGDRGSNVDNIRGQAYRRMPNMSIYERDDQGNPTSIFFTPDKYYQGSSITYNNGSKKMKFENYNPVAMAELASRSTLTDRIRTNLTLRYFPKPWITYMGWVAYDLSSGKTKDFLPSKVSGKSFFDRVSNVAGDRDTENITIMTNNELLIAPEPFGKHTFSYLVRLRTTNRESKGYGVITSNSASLILTDPSFDANIIKLQSYPGSSRELGVLHSMHYNYAEKYLLTASLRSDASSKFGANNRWGHFPSVSAGWRISEEPFLSNWEFLDDWKIRATYGEVGRTPYRDHYGKYSADKPFLDIGAINPTGIQLNNLRWETTREYDLGFDLTMFGDRLNVIFDWYDKQTVDQLNPNVRIPSSTGFSKVLQNYGTMTNKGWELAIFSRLIQKKDFKFELSFNISRNENIVDKMPASFQFERIDVHRNGNYARRVELGDPIGSFYGYRFLGVYKDDEDAVARDTNGDPIMELGSNNKPMYMQMGGNSNYIFKGGDAKYDDINKDGVIDELDIVYLGNAMPDVMGSVMPTISYKSLTLSMGFHYRLGQQVINRTRMDMESMYNKNNQSKSVLRRWRKKGDVTNMPRALFESGFNWLGSDRFVEDSDYVRLKNLSLAYRFGKRVLDRLNIKQLHIIFTGYDLYTWTNYSGQDPEVGLSSSDPFFIGVDRGRTPPSRSYTLGVKLTF
ncbi:MAG: TonB-dependent receptor [Cytophagales bacterium]|nr:TonB-dependent receptor [Cytophagales bacterium]